MSALSQESPAGKARPGGPARRIFRWGFRIVLLLVVLVVLLVGALPLLVSAFAGKAALERAARENLSAPFSVEKVSMNWSGGFGVEGLRIDQPEGFGAGPAVEIRKALLDVGLGKLLSGTYKVGVQVQGLRVDLVRNREGAFNLARLPKTPAPGKARPKASSPPASAGKGAAGEDPLSHLQAWFKLQDAEIRVKDLAGGISGRIALDLSISNDRPGAPFHLEGKALLYTGDGNPGGQLNVTGDIDPVHRKGSIRLKGGRMALETWRALLPVEESLKALKGNLGMDLRLRFDEKKLTASGKVELKDIFARLAALGGAPLRQSSWVLEPNLSLDLEKGEVDFSQVRADAGPLSIQGLDAAKAAEILGEKKAAGALLTLDLSRLPRIPGLLPADALLAGKIRILAALPEEGPKKIAFRLDGSGLAYRSGDLKAGPFSLEGKGGLDPAKGLEGIQARLTLKGVGAVLGENLIRDVLARLSLQGPKLEARIDKALVNGGPASGGITLRLGGTEVPLAADLHLDGASVNASLAPLLAYLLPFAVAPGDALLSGKAGVDLKLQGRVPGSGGLSVRRILEAVKGEGKLSLQGLTFQGSPALKQILAAFRKDGAYRFEGLTTAFRLDGGRILQKEIDIPHGGSRIKIRGFTDLAGNLDYTFDFSDLFKKNKKGRKILALLGGNAVPLKLGGTIYDPKPELKPLDLKSLLGTGAGALQEKAGKALEKGLEKGLRSLFGRKKKKKKKDG